jgi:hypothetical protein
MACLSSEVIIIQLIFFWKTCYKKCLKLVRLLGYYLLSDNVRKLESYDYRFLEKLECRV